MNKTILLATAAAFALCAGAASAGSSHPGVSAKIAPRHVNLRPQNGNTLLYDQSAGSNGIGIVSQNFEPTFSIYDSQGADDFKFSGKHTVTEVVANGVYFNGSGPATGFDVTFYKKIKNGKGKVLGTCANQAYTDLAFGYPDITLSGCKGKTSMKKGSVSVVADLAFGAGGEWGWNTNNTVVGAAGLWQNPGGGFSTGCSTYTAVTTCIPSGEGGDWAFALLGN
jgi:hypothetical protein